MTKIKLDLSTLKTMSLFSKITGVQPRDCFPDSNDTLIFVLNGKVGKAVGKNGANVKKLEPVLKRKIKIVEFNPDIKVFVQNLVHPIKLKDVELDETTLIMHPPDAKTRGILIGRAAQNLRNYETILKRYFPIEELKVP